MSANPVGDLLEDLAACLCAQITVDVAEDDTRQETCFCGVIPGDKAVANYGSNCKDKNGMAWVRLGGLYQATGLGQQSITPNVCSGLIGLDIEIGILRQMTAPKADGKPPSDAALLSTALNSTADALTIRRAIACCTSLKNYGFVLGDWVPGGPLGLMVGGAWRVSTAL